MTNELRQPGLISEELKKLQEQHAAARHEAMMRLQAQRHANRLEKQRQQHEHAKALAWLLVVLKREREAKQREERERLRLHRGLKVVAEALLASFEAEKKIYFAAFGIDGKAQGQ
jgi:hypothetical protein